MQQHYKLFIITALSPLSNNCRKIGKRVNRIQIKRKNNVNKSFPTQDDSVWIIFDVMSK